MVPGASSIVFSSAETSGVGEGEGDAAAVAKNHTNAIIRPLYPSASPSSSPSTSSNPNPCSLSVHVHVHGLSLLRLRRDLIRDLRRLCILEPDEPHPDRPARPVLA